MIKTKIYKHNGVSFYYDRSRKGYITILKSGREIVLHDSVEGAKWQIDWELSNLKNENSIGNELQVN